MGEIIKTKARVRQGRYGLCGAVKDSEVIKDFGWQIRQNIITVK